MASTSKIASAPGPKGLAAGFRAFFVSHFHACVVSAGGHGVYFENRPLSAGAGVKLSLVRPAPLDRMLDTKTGSGLDCVEVDTGLSRTGPVFSCLRGARAHAPERT